MSQIFIANAKGGCGKTTVAVHIAAYLANIGCEVKLLDHDAQRSSLDWFAQRPKSFRGLSVNTAGTTIAANCYDYIIHDMPAAWSPASQIHLFKPGDRLLLPVLASPTDMKACLRFYMELQRLGLFENHIKTGVVVNRTKNQSRYNLVLAEFLKRSNLQVLGKLRETQNYPSAMEKGLTIFDKPIKRWQKDVESWQSIVRWLACESTRKSGGQHTRSVKEAELG